MPPATGLRKYSLGWAEDILEEFLNLVDISLDLAVEGDEGGMCAWRQVLEVCRLPGKEEEQLQCTEADRTIYTTY